MIQPALTRVSSLLLTYGQTDNFQKAAVTRGDSCWDEPVLQGINSKQLFPLIRVLA